VKQIRERAAIWVLVGLLLVGPVAFGIHDLRTDGNLVRLGDNLVAGLSNGAIWALVALGYTLVYGIIELINFAHGDVFMLGSFSVVAIWTALGISAGTPVLLLVLALLGCLVAAMAICGALNVCIERVGYRPLRNAPKLAPLITAIGFSFILQNVAILWRGGAPLSVPDLIGVQTTLATVAGVTITRGDALAVGVTIPLLVLTMAIVGRSWSGRAMRAVAQDPDAARLMGINVDRSISLAFLVGGALAGSAGLIFALYQTTIWYFQGFTAGLVAFTAAVMGGIGNLRGAVLGGLVIGCVQQMSDNRLGAEWTSAIVFAYLILIVVLRPQGLLGERVRKEA
jgi:branched-chain amino acid transport system permease protein